MSGGGGEGTQSASGYCPGRHYPLAVVSGGTHLGGGGWRGIVSAVTPVRLNYKSSYFPVCCNCLCVLSLCLLVKNFCIMTG